MIFRQKKRLFAPHRGACVCGVAEYPATKTFFHCSRGHRPMVATCANEANPSWGKRGLIIRVYLLL